MANEQQQVTIEAVMQDFGARYNAEAIRLGDSLGKAFDSIQQQNAALKEQNDALIAKVSEAEKDRDAARMMHSDCAELLRVAQTEILSLKDKYDGVGANVLLGKLSPDEDAK